MIINVIINELTKCFNTKPALINSPLREATMTSHILTQEELKTQLHYNPETGIFTRKIPKQSIKVGASAGCLNGGYIQISVLNKKYAAHRLAWLYMTGDWPIDQIDHINGIRDDNRLCNLRECSQSENMMNIPKNKSNKSGIKGVFFDSHAKKWRASCRLDGKKVFLGSFVSPELAGIAYKNFAKLHHGDFYYAE